MTTEIGVMECFTKTLSRVTWSNRISLNIAILVEHG